MIHKRLETLALILLIMQLVLMVLVAVELFNGAGDPSEVPVVTTLH